VNLTFQEQFQMLKDVSLGAMSIFTWLLAVLPTAMLLPKDMEDRTLYTILAKPVPRFEYLLGKLLGILVLLAIATAVMSALFLAVLYSHEQTALADVARGTRPDQLEAALREVRASAFNINLLPGIVIIYVKAALCASLTLLLSTFASSWIFTVVVSVMIYFIGHLQGLARAVWLEHTGTMSVLTSSFLALVSIFFPDLQIFSLVDDVVAGTAIPAFLFFKTAFLGMLYTSAYLLVAYLMFAWKEL
jgi:ABC-2 type transport system permease protein